MIIAVRNYLASKKTANLLELSRFFCVDPTVLRAVLARLEQKGTICRRASPKQCGGKCQLCPVSSREVYQWVSDTGAPQASGTCCSG